MAITTVLIISVESIVERTVKIVPVKVPHAVV
jgi:hypothetical protein